MKTKQYLSQSGCTCILTSILALAAQSSMATEFSVAPSSSANSEMQKAQSKAPLAKRTDDFFKAQKLVQPNNSMLEQAQEAQHGSHWILFPSKTQNLMPYLDGVFLLGNECKQEGALIANDPLSDAAQDIKSAASEMGINYDLTMSFTYAGTSPSPSEGRRDFMAFNSSFLASWTIARDASGDQGVFLTLNVDFGKGLNFDQEQSSISSSIGSASNPHSSNRGGNGAYIPHFVLGYSGFEGKLVMMAGVLDLSAVFDLNSYSGNWTGNLMNESFNFSPVLPLSAGGLGYVVAWQPSQSFYMMNSSTATNALPNHSPFESLSSSEWTNITELGFIFENSLGLGAGTYRLQYAHTQLEDGSGSSVGINIEQQLGADSPLGFFSRWGISDHEAASYTGTEQAFTAGLVLQAPFRSKGWGSSSNNEQIALGFLWQKAARSVEARSHSSEYGVELSAVIQITPTFFLQPDIQFIQNPIHAGDHDNECIMQLQGVFRF